MNKKILVFSLVGIFAVMLVTAAIINYSSLRDVVVTKAFTFEGNGIEEVSNPAGEVSLSEEMNVESETSVNVPLSIITTPTDNPEITHTINYLLDNSEGTCLPYPSETCEKRIDFDGMALGNLSSISWDVDVLSGYIAHVDVKLDNGETLVFEYDKVDDGCGDGVPYPIGEQDTFGDKGIVDNDAYAWLGSGAAGNCQGDPDYTVKTLSDWKTTYPNAIITRIEIEVDNWIEASNSIVSDVVINGEDVSGEPFLLPEGQLNFNVATEFDVGIVEGTYPIETIVTTR